MLEDDKAEQHATWDLKNTFLGIEFDVICLEFCKGLLKISNEVVSPFGLNYDVINVGLNGSPDEVPETLEHTTLVCSSYVFQTKRHRNIAEKSKWGDKRSHELVEFSHCDLMVPRVCIKEAKGFTA